MPSTTKIHLCIIPYNQPNTFTYHSIHLTKQPTCTTSSRTISS
uniref:Uncharacterized protein n=1 Tax=Arundo donax TaxID=35708 RepID=A0A0A9FWS9_ARUDO